MVRFARVVSYAVIGLLAVAARVQAQAAPVLDTSRFYAEFTGGANFGHTSSGTLGAEGGYRIKGPWLVFFEAGHMFTVGSSDLDARAQTIGTAVGATTSASYKINYFDGGVRYNPKIAFRNMFEPYLELGFGGASVTARTTFAVNGMVVPPESLGVSLGDDLDGTVGKGFIMFGGGANYAFAGRYFADASLRYGHVLARTSVIENDTGINTLRLQFGVGIRFK
jgi:hypothetical protein